MREYATWWGCAVALFLVVRKGLDGLFLYPTEYIVGYAAGALVLCVFASHGLFWLFGKKEGPRR